jgi:hypothetical protein
VSWRDDLPAPLDALLRVVGGGSSNGDDERASTFARGLALGALVGAAIAGSTIWQRRHIHDTAGPDATSRALDSPKRG